MAYVILRISKLKTAQNIAASAQHNFRERPTDNANPALSRQNTTTGAQSAEAVVEGVDALLKTVPKVRSNAVLAVEYFIGASPEWMQKASREEQEAFFASAQEWLEKKHGKENVVAFTVHRDEMTPHACAYVVPIDERGKLNAAGFFGERKLMREMQSSFAEAVGASYGLQRGIKGSKARHITVQEFYEAIQTPTPSPEPEVPEPPPPTRSEKIAEMAGIETLHSRTVAAVEEKRRKNAAAKAQRLKIERDKAIAYDLEKPKHEARDKELARLREVAGNVRELPLLTVLDRLGFKPSAKDKHNYDTEVGRVTVTSQKFYNHDLGKGGGGAIDLVMHLRQCDYKSAVRELSQSFGDGPIVGDIVARASATVKEAMALPERPRPLPARVAEKWPGVRQYLVDVRHLAAGLVDALHEKGTLYADRFANACFLLNGGKGVEQRGTLSGSTYHGVRGKKTGFTLPPEGTEDKSHALVESAIDALSLRQLGFKGRITSMTGTASHESVVSVRKLAKEHREELIAAFDNDPAGHKMAAALGADAKRLRPQGKDWSDDLKAGLTLNLNAQIRRQKSAPSLER